jgi:hypothetical protein
MKPIPAVMCVVLLSGCAAQLNFIDRTDGQQHRGMTGSTAGSSGEARATIDGVEYKGTWIFSRSGGAYSLATINSTSSATAYGGGAAVSAYGIGSATATAIGISAHGRGLMHLRSSTEASIRCVFDFNTMSDTGIGECQRNDGRLFDLTINR